MAGPNHPFRSGPTREFRSRLGITTVPRIDRVSPNSGSVAGGTAVTITGDHFGLNSDGSAPAVFFGAFAATSVVVVSAQSITCVTGAASAAGLTDVTVTIGSETGTLAGGFTYYQGTIAAVSPKFGPFGGGTSVLITGYNFSAGTTVTFGGNAATGVQVIDDQNIVATTPAHAVGFVDVTITETGGATNTLALGFQYTLLTRGDDIRRTPGVSIRDVLNNAPNQCSFVVDGSSNIPEVGEEIQIVDSEDGDRLLFAGNVQSIEQNYEGQIDQLAFTVTCIDFTWRINKFRPVGVYTNASVSVIVADLVTKFAPGFTSLHVQTNLAPISISFDGSKDFATCLSDIAAALGGGHWYIDYTRDVHFFHKVPPNVQVPELPQSTLRLGPGSAMTVTSDSATVSIFRLGFYMFRTTFVYDNGVESAMGPISNMVACEGTRALQFTNIPIGAAVGALTCVKRRVYFKWFGPQSMQGFPTPTNATGYSLQWEKGFEIEDNVTVALNDANSGSTWVGPNAPYGLFISQIPDSVAVPFEPTVAPPPKPVGTLSLSAPADLYAGDLFSPPSPMIGTRTGLAYAQGAYGVSVAYLYRDGSVSFTSDEENITVFDSVNGAFRNVGGTSVEQVVTSGIVVGSVPIGPTINGVDVIARIVFAHYRGRSSSNGQWNLPEYTGVWGIVPDNTTTSKTVPDGMMFTLPVANGTNAETSALPPWPWPDGPSLEDDDPPTDLDDDNPYLLHQDSGQGLSMTIDGSQIRNQISVRGAGTNLSAKAIAGGVTLSVQNAAAFSAFGGVVFIQGQGSIPYFAVSPGSTTNPNGVVYLASPITVDIDQGTPILNYVQIDDVESQKAMGRVELDSEGNPTDGIHQFTIQDSNLTNSIQLYMRANAELELFARPIVTIRYSTRDPKTKSGQTVHVDMSNPPVHGDFLIQDVTIDQIRDEGDQLAPRYTVVASSVKFELTDLLLQIAQASSVSSGGAATTGVASTTQPADTTRGNLSKVVTRPQLATWIMQGTQVSAPGQSGAWNGQLGTWTPAVDVVTAYNRGTGSSQITNGPNSANHAWIEHLPYFQVRFRTGPASTDIAGTLFFITIGGTVTPQNNVNFQASGVSQKAVGIRYAASANDAGWRPFTNGGSAGVQTLYSPLTSIAPNTIYLVTIQVISSTKVIMDVNGFSTTIAIPALALSSILGPNFAMWAQDGVTTTKRVDFFSAYFDRN